jgi:hypothetical protein
MINLNKSKASDFYTTEKVAILGLPFPVTPGRKKLSHGNQIEEEREAIPPHIDLFSNVFGWSSELVFIHTQAEDRRKRREGLSTGYTYVFVEDVLRGT